MQWSKLRGFHKQVILIYSHSIIFVFILSTKLVERELSEDNLQNFFLFNNYDFNSFSTLSLITSSAKLVESESSLTRLKKEVARLAEEEIPSMIKDSASLQVTKILLGDYNLKIARQDYFTSNQEEVREVVFNTFCSIEYNWYLIWSTICIFFILINI